MKIVIFTRTGFHHTCFINRLQERFQVACVVREAYPQLKKENPLFSRIKDILNNRGAGKASDSQYMKRFYEQYSAGFRYSPLLKDFMKAPFDVLSEKAGTQYVNVKCGDINCEQFAVFLRELRPDIIAVLGSSVIKPSIISIPSVALLNLHSGLSPYYRGTWSYGWPLVNDEPGYIGATVHYVNEGIDTGDIIFQTRPVLDNSDDLNRIFLKVISEGVEIMSDAIDNIIRETVVSFAQPQAVGRHYKTSDLNEDAAKKCLLNLEQGALRKYNADKERIDSGIALYGYKPPRYFT
jgi:methionyl-tRNA formyltransferase